jgi:hypothetical protein
MNTAEVEAMVRNVIVHLGLPFSVLSVVGSSAGFNIRVRASTGGTVAFTVIGERPISLRAAVQQKLEDSF